MIPSDREEPQLATRSGMGFFLGQADDGPSGRPAPAGVAGTRKRVPLLSRLLSVAANSSGLHGLVYAQDKLQARPHVVAAQRCSTCFLSPTRSSVRSRWTKSRNKAVASPS